MTAIGHITTDDECRIAFRLVERSRAPVVVLSPSLGTAMGLFDRQVEALAKEHKPKLIIAGFSA